MKPINENDLEQLSAYIDGELSDSERRFFQKRLASDETLRAYCERAWIASSVLKSQHIQLMPIDGADRICMQCEPLPRRFKASWSMVASFGAMALVAALGYQLLLPASPHQTEIAQTVDVAQTKNSDSKIAAVPDAPKPTSVQAIDVVADKSVKSLKPTSDSGLLASSDPSQFELNEETRSTSWPKRVQGMDDYVVRHNEMAGARAGNGLVSYAQMLAQPEQVDAPPSDQGKERDPR
jgi:anti-sigma factor RsiW